ncbi:MAG: PaaI family thioesterase [Thaumarchaeota archaeon]|nr:PaaI family thioesterase [Nitrososphaerota archaeon]
MPEMSLQDRYAPQSVCFGCGPANDRGLRIKSRVEGGELVCDWMPQPYHHAFDGILNGGITGTILDCHSNWTAVHSLMERDRTELPPPTVTADFTIKMLRPTPMDAPLHLRARVVELAGERVVVEATLEADAKLRATFRGTFIAVKEGHPAYARWR